MEEKVTLNGQEMSKEELKEQKEKLEQKPGVKVVETGEATYRTRLED